MADATRFQVLSKQIEEQKQAADSISTQIEKLTQSQAQIDRLVQSQQKMEAMMATLISQTSIPARPPSQPPDPPDCKSHTEFPKFDGTLVREWFRRCEQYFYLHKTPPEMRVRIATPHMIGKALQWHTNYIRNNFGMFPPWLDYTIAISAEFGDEDALLMHQSSLSPYQNQYNQSHYKIPNTISLLPPLETTKALPYKPNFPTEINMENSPRKLSHEEIQESGMRVRCESSDGSYANGHHLESKKSQMFVIECEDATMFDDEKPDEESNPENESMSEVLLSQSQVSFSPLEPSHRCHKTHNHYESLDLVDKIICDEPVCDKDGDYILTVSAKFREIYEDPRYELVCLKQSPDPVESHLDNFEFALTRSPLRHTPTDQYRVPFNPYQSYSDQSHNKSEFGNSIGPEIEFDRESEEIEDDELQDKQPEDEVFVVDVKTLVMTEDKQPLECDDEIVSVDEESDLVTVEETAVSSILKPPTTFSCMRVLGRYKIMKMYILIDPGDATSGNNIQTSHKCVDVENWSPPLEDDFYGIKSQQQHMNNRKVTLRLVILVIVDRVVKREKDYDGALLAPLDDTVAFSNLDAQQLHMQQLDPLLMLIRIIVVPFSTLILMTCKVLELVKDKASRKRKLYKDWWFKYKLNTWLSEALHFWRKRKYEKLQRASEDMRCELIYKIRKACHCVVRKTSQTTSHVWYGWKTKAEIMRTVSIPIMHLKGKEETFSYNIAGTSCSRFCSFSHSSWMVSHNKYDLSSCVLRREKNYVMVLFPIGEALTLVNDLHTLVAQKKGTETSTGCCYGSHADLDLMADVTAGTTDISMDEFSSVCKLLFGVFVLNLIADQVRDWSFFGLLLQWKWHPPPQATSEFNQALTNQSFIFEDKDALKEGVLLQDN